MIEAIKLQIQILKLQLQKALLDEKVTIPNLGNPTKIIVHHGGGWMDFEGVNEYHKQKWGFKSSLGFYIGYTYFIDRSGTIHQGRRDNEEGAHTKGFNQRTIGICMMGNGEEKDFTMPQYQALEGLILKKCKEYGIPKDDIYGHQNFAATLCPSTILYKWLLKIKVA